MAPNVRFLPHHLIIRAWTNSREMGSSPNRSGRLFNAGRVRSSACQRDPQLPTQSVVEPGTLSDSCPADTRRFVGIDCIGWAVDGESISARSTTLPDCSWQVCVVASDTGTGTPRWVKFPERRGRVRSLRRRLESGANSVGEEPALRRDDTGRKPGTSDRPGAACAAVFSAEG